MPKEHLLKEIWYILLIFLQDKEAHLDIIMDRMRQDSTEKSLKDSLTRALEMLEKIRLAYVSSFNSWLYLFNYQRQK